MSQIVIAFERTWLDQRRSEGVRVVRALEKWVAAEDGVVLKSSTGNSLTLEMKASDRESFVNRLAERMREFAWEGWRRQDLIRFGKFTDKWSSHPVLPGEESGYTTVFPIPADVLDLNPLLKQNPGY